VFLADWYLKVTPKTMLGDKPAKLGHLVLTEHCKEALKDIELSNRSEQTASSTSLFSESSSEDANAYESEASALCDETIPSLATDSDSSSGSVDTKSSVAGESSSTAESSAIPLGNYLSVCAESLAHSVGYPQDESVTVSPLHRVSWGNLTTRKYPVIPGDHPDTNLGAPLTIAWDYVSESSESIDDYESGRAPRRHDEELRLGWIIRRRLLLGLGATEAELSEAQSLSYQARRQREVTLSRLPYQMIDEAKDRIFRKLRHIVSRKQKLITKY
jgi:hypothetical protein